MSTHLSILFLMKRSKISSKGLCPIHLRVTFDGKRLEITTGRFIEPDKWCIESGKVKGRSADVRETNTYLDILRSRVYSIQNELIQSGETISVEEIRNKLTGVEDNKKLLLVILNDHNLKMEQLVGNEYAKGTLVRYKSCYRHLKNFLRIKYNVSDIDISKVNLEFINNFEHYLRTKEENPCSNNSAVKYIKNLSKVIRICLANEWLDRDPLIGYKSKYTEVNRKFLDDAELRKIELKEFNIERMEIIRDMFVFSCYTGLSFIDVRNLTADNIGVGIDGRKWIFTARQKTKIASNIPLLEKAEKILFKYKDYPMGGHRAKKLLPIPVNQKMNAYLKEVADLCGISKELTFHIARHTFATTVTLSNGVSIESVSKMLGHKSIKTTQIYAKIMDRKVSDEMDSLSNLLERKEKSFKNI
ncbi:site-specific integrase [Chryseobacterium wangxinyae]|uniref:site-specific integrase n=1 Tax=Chryseobacterium sp. CY350 TaxID=2997336 RepID=UPI002272138F|nr:site-specific integrase [Chryseobacterium sp. CY350]MCY0976947.1 site-specific integrase [Chryseobacterium sp. CY350]WBZ96947.1 site-specific integrase [Chryseobacterium sp. CY350]